MARDPMLRMLERAEKQEMDSTVRIESVEEQFDDTTGENSTVVTATHYDGPALIRPEPDRLVEVEAGEGQAGITLYAVTIEHDADVPRDARVTVTGSLDDGLTDRVLWVFDYKLSDWQVNRDLVCRETR